MLRILIIDDNPYFLHALRRYLQTQPEVDVVGVIDSAQRLAETLAELEPDMVLTDLSLPGISGFQIIEWTVTHYPMVVCLAVSLHDSEEYRCAALAAGAQGFVTKSRVYADLMPTIRLFLPKSQP